MPRSFTDSQIKKLGDRLRRAEQPDAADLQMLQRFREEHDPVLQSVEDALRTELGIEVASRLKTVGTIVDKLKRERTRLNTMQDIAGVRTVLPTTLVEQNALVDLIRGRFPSSLVDRRDRPSHGYRAVHVIAEVDTCLVEIQVRTRIQHWWAQLLEKIADTWGRQVRYGQEPTEPGQDAGGRTRLEVVEAVMRLSGILAEFETLVAAGRDREAAELLERITSIAVGLPR